MTAPRYVLDTMDGGWFGNRSCRCGNTGVRIEMHRSDHHLRVLRITRLRLRLMEISQCPVCLMTRTSPYTEEDTRKHPHTRARLEHRIIALVSLSLSQHGVPETEGCGRGGQAEAAVAHRWGRRGKPPRVRRAPEPVAAAG